MNSSERRSLGDSYELALKHSVAQERTNTKVNFILISKLQEEEKFFKTMFKKTNNLQLGNQSLTKETMSSFEAENSIVQRLNKTNQLI